MSGFLLKTSVNRDSLVRVQAQIHELLRRCTLNGVLTRTLFVRLCSPCFRYILNIILHLQMNSGRDAFIVFFFFYEDTCGFEKKTNVGIDCR